MVGEFGKKEEELVKKCEQEEAKTKANKDLKVLNSGMYERQQKLLDEAKSAIEHTKRECKTKETERKSIG